MFKFFKKQPKTEEAKYDKNSVYDKKPHESDKAAKTNVVEKSKSSTKADSKKEKKVFPHAGYGILMKPHATEKTAHAGVFDSYSFIVPISVNKIQIRDAFWKMYGIKPISVNTIISPASATQFKRISGTKSAWKKAYIRVPKGSNITVYEGV